MRMCLFPHRLEYKVWRFTADGYEVVNGMIAEALDKVQVDVLRSTEVLKMIEDDRYKRKTSFEYLITKDEQVSCPFRKRAQNGEGVALKTGGG